MTVVTVTLEFPRVLLELCNQNQANIRNFILGPRPEFHTKQK